MQDEFSKLHAKTCLRSNGFTVEDIRPVPGERRADLRVRWRGEEYIIEAKSKTETATWRTLVSEARAQGLATIGREVKQVNAVSALIRNAYKQLLATPAGDRAFRILWLVAAHPDSSFVLSSVEKRLYGLENLVAIRSSREPPGTRVCYYYSHSDFLRFPGLDAAILSTREGGHICINSFSPRRDQLRMSHLYEILAQSGAVQDPEIEEKRGHAFLIDGLLNRSPRGEQWNFLWKKYGYKTCVMGDSYFNGLVSIELDQSKS
jgi:hypothetical protein